jgi:serine/threonine protein phosphatase PrpC
VTSSAVAQLVVGARTDVGSVRKRNEDSIYTEPLDSPQILEHGWVGVVADGLGGHPSGDFASRLAAQTTRDVFYKRAHGATGERLRSAVEKANDVIVQTAQTEVQHAEMASTITAAVIQGATVFMAQVGDSRGYLIRNGRVRRLTHDHSLVDELVRNGELTAEEALHHPQRNVITRALGVKPTVEVDVFEEKLRDEDIILLCSDGLYRMVEDSEIARAMIAEPQQAVETLIALANQRGGPDNISVVAVRITLPASLIAEPTPPRRQVTSDDETLPRYPVLKPKDDDTFPRRTTTGDDTLPRRS